MNFFETLLVLLLVAVLLLQVARRLSVPYPSMLAMAGTAVALVPGVPYIALDPEIALALFIAPALLDAAFDFPLGTARRYWVPLVVFAVGGVVVTALTVAVAAGLMRACRSRPPWCLAPSLPRRMRRRPRGAFRHVDPAQQPMRCCAAKACSTTPPRF